MSRLGSSRFIAGRHRSLRCGSCSPPCRCSGKVLLPRFFFSNPSMCSAVLACLRAGDLEASRITLWESILAFVIGWSRASWSGFWFARQPTVAAFSTPM